MREVIEQFEDELRRSLEPAPLEPVKAQEEAIASEDGYDCMDDLKAIR